MSRSDLAVLGVMLVLVGCGDTGDDNGSPQDCHPSYVGACLDPNASDYDCRGGSGDGPNYVGRVEVTGPDPFDLDRDRNGVACE